MKMTRNHRCTKIARIDIVWLTKRVILVWVMLCLVSCADSNQDLPEVAFTEAKSSRLQIWASDPTVTYFVNRVGGTQVDVHYIPHDVIRHEEGKEKPIEQPKPFMIFYPGDDLLWQKLVEKVPCFAYDIKFPDKSDDKMESFAFEFKKANQLVNAIAQFLMMKDALHQELYLLNADLLSTEILRLQQRWSHVQSAVDVEIRAKGLDPGKEKGAPAKTMRIRDEKDSSEDSSLPLKIHKFWFENQSWLKIWEENLTKIEATLP